MKKPLLLLFLGAGLFTQAQITITSADLVGVNKVLIQAHDTTVSTISVGSAGASQTWNMSALGANYEDTLTTMPYSSAPNPSFSSANLVIKYGYQQIFNYMNVSSSMLSGLGIGAMVDFGTGLTPFNQVNTPAEKMAVFPSTFGTTFSETHTAKSSFYYGASGVDSIRTRSTIQKTSTADAWGNITTPLGTYASLRFYELQRNWDTTEYYVAFLGGWQTDPAGVIPPQYDQDSAKSFTWWANSVGFPLVEATVDYNTLTPTEISWLKAIPMTVGINESALSVSEINAYPNPAVNEINFALDPSKVEMVQIYDLTGRMIASEIVSSDITSVNTSAFAPGIYTFNVIGKDNLPLKRGKFTKN
ncbi:MAG: hypothetical protein K0Q95_1835 [Bacteroidota bacterium]|jgi:hypothetical protein|nr:hypothetical protein [Bacteroidota bacterium]